MQRAYRKKLGYYEDRAGGLLASAADGTPSAVAAFERWDAPLTADGARIVVAREHGVASWDALRQHLDGLGRDPFARAYRAIEARDVDALREQLECSPEIARAQATNGNDLLGMATATHDERLVSLLLARGADPASANVHGSTALHQAAYAGLPALAALLIEAGAPVGAQGRGEGGTPLVVALFWGHARTAELLAGHGIEPGNLRTAAGLGRCDLVEQLVGAGGELEPRAGARRGYYRPHSGFPAWQPSDDPREILDESLAWAARNDRTDVLDVLVARGADLEADVYRGTALTWAAASDRRAALQRLLALGADPNGRSSFGGPDHGERATPLHLAAGGGHREAVELLLAAGADPRLRDGCHDSTPAGWAEHAGGHAELVALLREREAA
ncbi:MAG TPA: ankyrin repeat domain-containing protein [Solirubrobacteraceae bacterium]|jgi:ankyrin repeat protein